MRFSRTSVSTEQNNGVKNEHYRKSFNTCVIAVFATRKAQLFSCTVYDITDKNDSFGTHVASDLLSALKLQSCDKCKLFTLFVHAPARRVFHAMR